MCGIFGILTKKENDYEPAVINKMLKELAFLSMSRGKDSSGIVFRNVMEHRMDVIKGAVAAKELLKSKSYKDLLGSVHKGDSRKEGFAAMGHARLVTNGTQLRDENNQPVVKDGIMAIHNGIVVNVDELWQANPDLNRTYEIDTEVMLALTRNYLNEGLGTARAVASAVNQAFGTVAISMFFADRPEVVLATNNGSLYTLYNDSDLLLFASEKYFLQKLADIINIEKIVGNYTIRQVLPDKGMLIDLSTFEILPFGLKEEIAIRKSKKQDVFEIAQHSVQTHKPPMEVIVEIANIHLRPEAALESSLLENNWGRISHLKRCTKCLLPETFPYIYYDDEGVCNYCHNYQIKNQPKPIEKLFELVEPFRRKDGQPDCLVPFSGGRDSTFTLHIVKNVLKLNPVTFTYDWGMVTDLARRNIARVCGKMGVENIIVSANIHWKRENIRKNILAWLKQPELGMIPLFMAGDKYFFYYTDKVKKQTGIKLNIWGVNPLENTDFKTGFCGVPPQFDKKRIYSLSLNRQLKLFGFIARNLVTNPSLVNNSIWDTFGSFLSRYAAPKRDYYHMFDYWRWDQNEIEKILFNEYNWETAVDTKTTWRIGDGTAGFYNYLYFTVAGFSEYETFKSNQIREGMITREEGLRLIEQENFPRYSSIKWYLDIIGLDFKDVIETINRIPKLYP